MVDSSMRFVSFIVLVFALGTACEEVPMETSLRVEGSGDCATANVTIAATPPLGQGQATLERAELSTLPWEATRSFAGGTEVMLMANAFSCSRLICTLVADGREVTRTVGRPIEQNGSSATCTWRVP